MDWLGRRLKKLTQDPRIGIAVRELREGWRIFGELRGVLRLSNSELPGSSRGSRQLPILCGSLGNLPAAFASQDRDLVAEVQLTRDHRDSHLDRLVRELLERTPSLADAGRLPPMMAPTASNAPLV